MGLWWHTRSMAGGHQLTPVSPSTGPTKHQGCEHQAVVQLVETPAVFFICFGDTISSNSCLVVRLVLWTLVIYFHRHKLFDT